MQAISAPKWLDSLSVKLLAITIGVILLVELIIFVPSAINFRNNWLDERVQAARLAVLSLEAAPSRSVSEELSRELLENAEIVSVVKIGNDRRELVLAPKEAVTGDMIEINRSDPNWYARMRMATGHTLSQFFRSDHRIMLVSSNTDMGQALLEVQLQEAPLRADLRQFSSNIFWLSLLISIIAGGLVYLVLDFLDVRPMRGVTESLIKFRNDPGATKVEHTTSTRKDEIGRAQNALSDMEKVVSDSFRQRERLAQLGEAVAKINHDLRNSLAAAQLVSDGLSHSEDPRVQRAAPRLERALERAIKLAQDTLQYGKSEPPAPNLQTVKICEIAEEALIEGLSGFPNITWHNHITEGTMHKLDPDHLHRILSNLIRNAGSATAQARGDEAVISVALDNGTIIVSDNGPGLPKKTLDNLFVPFASSATTGGTGLGLVIARDLSKAMGGDLKLGSTGDTGTEFHIKLP